LKRQLTGAWDLAFAWLIDEPHQHHPALPVRTMLSLVGIALMWGWPVEAAIIALTWTGALRIGEDTADLATLVVAENTPQQSLKSPDH
jgi:hypothetical protein